MEELIDRIKALLFEVISLVRARCWYTASKALRQAANLCDQVFKLEEEERTKKVD